MTLKQAAQKILKPHVAAMRSYAKAHPMPPPPERRTWPTAAFAWRRYLSSMITVQTRSGSELWEGLYADPAWLSLRAGGPTECPGRRTLASFLKRHRIRFPFQKAALIRRAIERDFDGLAAAMRTAFANVHDKRLPSHRRRDEEVRLAELVQEELAKCGVAPKVARLALMGATEITQLIPIDSRWQNALADAGHRIDPADLSREATYRAIEDVLCEVAHELGVRPVDADGIPFGWLVGEGA